MSIWCGFGIFVVGLECFDERSGGILAVFGAGVECFDERSGGMLALFGAGMGLMSIHLTIGKIACIKRLIKQKNA